ncbi:hypothetical protein X777_12909 [Ooceraea biroi]|uniref:Helix-turn-helix domain-containing protein n=1 Tax=Ooceraea biroi TaxID=2015173 RepID=A0A026VZ41_OOCBI|nr:hypothetical protein X777_12909 [Ooceraea biroi]
MFNNYHSRLKFTYEVGDNGSISFLDTEIIVDNGTIITNWYRKPTFSGRYINYFSNHPFKYKISVINSLVDRAILLSDDRFHVSNITIVKDILSNNGYPVNIINKYVLKRIKHLKHKNGRHNLENERKNKNKERITIPYIKNLSSTIGKILNSVGFQVAYTVPNKLDQIIKRGKDMLPKLKQMNVVYKINCLHCDACYVGQTKRHVETRLREHMVDVRKSVSDHSVVSKHRVTYDHDFDWSDPLVLHRDEFTRRREIAEMYFIKKQTKPVNLQRDTNNLPGVYDRVIRSA